MVEYAFLGYNENKRVNNRNEVMVKSIWSDGQLSFD